MRVVRAALLLWVLGCLPAAAAPAVDPESGLVQAPGWRTVAAHCGACHSYRLVTAQRGDADFWRGLIRWMQRTQNLWEIPPEQEDTIVAYLAEHYAETEGGRRPPLPARLLPPLEEAGDASER
jgi:hypothetical protein